MEKMMCCSRLGWNGRVDRGVGDKRIMDETKFQWERRAVWKSSNYTRILVVKGRKRRRQSAIGGGGVPFLQWTRFPFCATPDRRDRVSFCTPPSLAWTASSQKHIFLFFVTQTPVKIHKNRAVPTLFSRFTNEK